MSFLDWIDHYRHLLTPVPPVIAPQQPQALQPHQPHPPSVQRGAQEGNIVPASTDMSQAKVLERRRKQARRRAAKAKKSPPKEFRQVIEEFVEEATKKAETSEDVYEPEPVNCDGFSNADYLIHFFNL